MLAVDDYVDQDCSSTSCAVTDTYGPIKNWCTDDVTNMSFIFSTGRNANISSFNEDISGWNVGKVTTMFEMFRGATSFNQDFSTWDTSKVFAFDGMFRDATNFNGDVTTWDLSSSLDMPNMFRNSAFNRDVTDWRDTFGTVRSFRSMFRQSPFNLNLCGWSNDFPYDTATVDTMFAGSGCPNTNSPEAVGRGPFCFDCSQVRYIPIRCSTHLSMHMSLTSAFSILFIVFK